jgi:hypothetical protein
MKNSNSLSLASCTSVIKSYTHTTSNLNPINLPCFNKILSAVQRNKDLVPVSRVQENSDQCSERNASLETLLKAFAKSTLRTT